MSVKISAMHNSNNRRSSSRAGTTKSSTELIVLIEAITSPRACREQKLNNVNETILENVGKKREGQYRDEKGIEGIKRGKTGSKEKTSAG